MTKGTYDKNNIFAKIIRKEAKANIVFENNEVRNANLDADFSTKKKIKIYN